MGDWLLFERVIDSNVFNRTPKARISSSIKFLTLINIFYHQHWRSTFSPFGGEQIAAQRSKKLFHVSSLTQSRPIVLFHRSKSRTMERAEQWKHTFLPSILARNPIRLFYFPYCPPLFSPLFFFFTLFSLVLSQKCLGVSGSICCAGKLISVLSLYVPLPLFLLPSHLIAQMPTFHQKG